MNRALSRILPGLVVAAAMTVSLSACSNLVASNSLVRPTDKTAALASTVLQDSQNSKSVHLVYGYGPKGPANCAADASDRKASKDRYGVLICDTNAPLAQAYYPNGTSAAAAGDSASDDRLARIAANSMIPVTTVEAP